MKRLTAAVVVLLLLIPALPCRAAERFYTEYVQKSERSKIFYIDLYSGSDVSAAVFELAFDDSMVSYASVAASVSTSSVRGRETDGKVKIAFADSSAVSGRLCRFSFKAIRNGTADFVLHTVQAVDADLKSLDSDDHTLTLSFGKGDASSSGIEVVPRSAGDSSSSKSGSSSRSSSKSSVKVDKDDKAKKSKASSKIDKSSSAEDEDDGERMSDEADVIDLRRTETDVGKWILIGAGIPVLIAALILVGVMIGRRTNGQAKKEKPEEEISEPDHDSEVTNDNEE